MHICCRLQLGLQTAFLKAIELQNSQPRVRTYFVIQNSRTQEQPQTSAMLTCLTTNLYTKLESLLFERLLLFPKVFLNLHYFMDFSLVDLLRAFACHMRYIACCYSLFTVGILSGIKCIAI